MHSKGVLFWQSKLHIQKNSNTKRVLIHQITMTVLGLPPCVWQSPPNPSKIVSSVDQPRVHHR